ncbi:MAG: hypothetical protein JSU92_12580, partial [Deltaproteobacteria bacterium]
MKIERALEKKNKMRKILLFGMLAIGVLTAGLLIWGCGDDGKGGGVPEFIPVITGFGISSHISTGDSEEASAKRENELIMTRDIGVKLLRRDFLWRDIEPEKGSFSFDKYDT